MSAQGTSTSLPCPCAAVRRHLPPPASCPSAFIPSDLSVSPGRAEPTYSLSSIPFHPAPNLNTPPPPADGTPLIQDFNRIMTTVFNGASIIAQAGGLACLQDEGWAQMLQLVEFYKENAAILR